MEAQKPRWEVVAVSSIGAAHIRLNKPNQDAALGETLTPLQDICMATVADGHGSDKCFRSAIGAAIAVDIAKMAARELVCAPALDSHNLDWLVRDRLARQIVHDWRTQVLQHWTTHPLNPNEQPDGVQLDFEEPYLAYGSTLLIALITPDYLVCMQLGDGDIVIVNDHETSWPIEADQEQIANQTHSLCEPNAAQKWRISIQALRGAYPRLVLLATDGYSNSYSSKNDFGQVALDLADQIQANGIDAVNKALPEWLKETSAQGSGDDISVSLISLAHE